MRNICNTSLLCLVLILALLFEPILYAQDTTQQTTAMAQQAAADAQQPIIPRSASSSVPVPKQIQTAQTVFIANGGDTSQLFPDVFSGGPDRPYVQFYSIMQKWGRYQIVSSPDQADLVMEISISNPMGPENSPANDAPGTDDPQLRLKILDPHTHIALWTLTSHVELHAFSLKSSRDQEFDIAVGKLGEELERLSTQSTTTADNSVLREPGHGAEHVLAAVLIGAMVIGTIAGFVAIHNAASNQLYPPTPPQPPLGYSPYPVYPTP